MELQTYYYKGFDSNLACEHLGNYIQYEIGGEYETPYHSSSTELPRLCSNQGIHYCKKLRDVFEFYPESKKSRYCLIEDLGRTKSDSLKSCTTKIKVIRELTADEIFDFLTADAFNLDIVQKLQTQYNSHVGGSIGLYLHGIKLERWKSGRASSDIDIVLPYYQHPVSTPDCELTFSSDKSSANDFDYTFGIDNVKIDVKVDPKQKYEIITYKEFPYKVSNLLTIVEAKMRYAMAGNKKHTNDLKEMLLGKQPEKKLPTVDDLFA